MKFLISHVRSFLCFRTLTIIEAIANFGIQHIALEELISFNNSNDNYYFGTQKI